MNFHESLEQAAKWDNWYKQLDHAFSHGEDNGIKKQDWKEIATNQAVTRQMQFVLYEKLRTRLNAIYV